MNRERRYIFVGGIILLLFGAVYRFYPDLRDEIFLESQIKQKKKRLAKYQQLTREKEILEANLSGLEEQLKIAEGGLLLGETPAIAAVEIQNALNEIAGQNEIDIQSMQVMKPEGDKSELYLAVPVQISIETDARGLKNVLYAVETAPKALRISNLKIRAFHRGIPGRIHVTFTVTGYMKKKIEDGG